MLSAEPSEPGLRRASTPIAETAGVCSRLPPVRMSAFAQPSLGPSKGRKLCQVVPDRVTKSQQSLTEPSPGSEGDRMCEPLTSNRMFLHLFQ